MLFMRSSVCASSFWCMQFHILVRNLYKFHIMYFIHIIHQIILTLPFSDHRLWSGDLYSGDVLARYTRSTYYLGLIGQTYKYTVVGFKVSVLAIFYVVRLVWSSISLLGNRHHWSRTVFGIWVLEIYCRGLPCLCMPLGRTHVHAALRNSHNYHGMVIALSSQGHLALHAICITFLMCSGSDSGCTVRSKVYLLLCCEIWDKWA